MTEKELGQLYYLNVEIRELKNELQQMKDKSLLRGHEINDIPCRSDVTDKVADWAVKAADIKRMIDEAITKSLQLRERIELFISEIEQTELRIILRMRVLDNMSWYQIGDELDMDRRTAQKRYQKVIDMYCNVPV